MLNLHRYEEEDICLERRLFIATTVKTKYYVKFDKNVESLLIEHLSIKHNDSAQKLSCEFGIEFNGNDFPIDDVVEITTLQVAGKVCQFHIPGRSALYAKVWVDANTAAGIFTVIGIYTHKREINPPGLNKPRQ